MCNIYGANCTIHHMKCVTQTKKKHRLVLNSDVAKLNLQYKYIELYCTSISQILYRIFSIANFKTIRHLFFEVREGCHIVNGLTNIITSEII